MKMRQRWLILALSVFAGISITYCGNKKSGLLLLPNLASGQGGPEVSPEAPKTISQEVPTTQQTPSLEVGNHLGVVDTASLNTATGETSQTAIADSAELNQDNSTTASNNADSSSSQDTQNAAEESSAANQDTPSVSEENPGVIEIPELPEIVEIVEDKKEEEAGPSPIVLPGDPDEPVIPVIPCNVKKPLMEACLDDVVVEPVEMEVIKLPKEKIILPVIDLQKEEASTVPAKTKEDVSSEKASLEKTTETAAQKQEVEEEIFEEDTAEADADEIEDNFADTSSLGDKEEVLEDKNCKVFISRIDTTQGSWYNTNQEKISHPVSPNKQVIVKGIHTYWGYQNLIVNIKSTCDTRNYRLVLVAKNIHGPLPNWYHFFNIKVVDAYGQTAGTLLVRASDKNYHRGYIDIPLRKGDNTFNLLWTNDAWKQDEYDANIQIKRILVLPKTEKDKKQILSRRGSNICDAEGRWFIGVNPPSVYTWWQDQTVSYCFRTSRAGKYEIYVKGGNAKDGWPLVPEYEEFKLLVTADGKSNYLSIPAKQGEYKVGKTTLDLPEGDVKINFTWLNDVWQPERGYDTNIEILGVKIKRIGDADSPISAYLLQNPKFTYTVVIPGIILVGGILIFLFRYKQEKTA